MIFMITYWRFSAGDDMLRVIISHARIMPLFISALHGRLHHSCFLFILPLSASPRYHAPHATLYVAICGISGASSTTLPRRTKRHAGFYRTSHTKADYKRFHIRAPPCHAFHKSQNTSSPLYCHLFSIPLFWFFLYRTTYVTARWHFILNKVTYRIDFIGLRMAEY